MSKRSKAPTPGKVPPHSERSFGLLFTGIFLILGAYAYVKEWPRYEAAILLILGAGLLPISLFSPGLLSPLNKGWFLLGQALGKMTGPLVMGLIFFLLVTPIALVGRLIGRDELNLRKRPLGSFWIERKPAGPSPASFKRQY